MYLKSRIAFISAAFASGIAMPAMAADLEPLPIIEAPAPITEVEVETSGGWYLRGDIGYSMQELIDDRVDYVAASGAGMQHGTLNGEIDNTYSFGVGVGYDTGHYFRGDLTLDYFAENDFTGYSEGYCTPVGGGAAVECRSSDISSFTALSMMANAYIDLGTYHGFTPYVGGGIGGTYIGWETLSNTIEDGYDQSGTETHTGHKDWRFTWAVMAGASVDITSNIKLDAGYRYRRITGGKMFEVGDGLNGAASYTGPGHDRGFSSHDFRLGARYTFGKKTAHYTPVNDPYTPVYK